MATNHDKQFAEWLKAQPDDRIFRTAPCGCPLACFGREVLKYPDPTAGMGCVNSTQNSWPFESAEIPSAILAVSRLIAHSDESGTITAKQFKDWYHDDPTL